MTEKKQKPAEKPMHLTFCLDETGSMNIVKDSTISGYNEFLADQQRGITRPCTYTLILFNAGQSYYRPEIGGDALPSGGIRTVHNGIPLVDALPLTAKTYMPNNNTPLFDAIVQGIRDTEAAVAGKDVDVLFEIMTDGQENASKQYKREQVFDLIRAKEAAGWTFGFLGANMDSWEIGVSIGLSTADAVQDYSVSNMAGAFKGASAASLRYSRHSSEVHKRGLFVKDDED